MTISLDPHQQKQIEKVAGLFNIGRHAYNIGSKALAPLDWAATGLRYAATPATWALGKGLKGAGAVAGKAADHVINPALMTAGGLALKGGALAAPLAVGAGGRVIKSGLSNVVAPTARWYGRRLKNSPISTVATTGFAGMGVKDIYRTNKMRPFTTGPQAKSAYSNTREQFNKVGMDMHTHTLPRTERTEKTASLLGAAKKVVNYGGSGPSILGYGVLAALPVLAAPTLQGLGESMKRTVFPLDARINAEEEVAKKQLSMATEQQMSQTLLNQREQGRRAQDIPLLEGHINYLVHNDPVINEFALQDPRKIDNIRETLHTVYNFAPDIAINRQAAQSILREAAAAPDGGLNYNTVKLLSEAQKSVGQGKKQ